MTVDVMPEREVVAVAGAIAPNGRPRRSPSTPPGAAASRRNGGQARTESDISADALY